MIEAWGARALVNLMEDHEYELLRVPYYVAKARSFQNDGGDHWRKKYPGF